MSDPLENSDTRKSQAVAPVVQEASSPPGKLPVAWVAGMSTLDALAPTVNPLAVGLIDEMIDLLVICPEGALHSLPSPPVKMLTYQRLRWWFFDTPAARQLAGQVQSSKVGLLHALDVQAVGVTANLARKADLPYVVSCHWPGDARLLGRLDGRLAAVLADSQAVRSELLARRVAPEGKVHLLRPGVHPVRHATCFSDPRRSVSILAAGRMDRLGAFRAILKSFNELRQRELDCVFFIVGSGRAEKHIRKEADRLSLRAGLTFVDRVPPAQMPGILKAADIFISPVSGRAQDNSSLLAMAAGVPVLAAADQPCDHLVDGQTALLYRQEDSAELTDKLTGLFDDKAAARALAESALGYVRRNHSPAEMVRLLAKIYRQAAS